VSETAAAPAPDNSRPALVTFSTVLVLAAGAFGVAYGTYQLVEPASCAQTGSAGECLRTRVPSESSRQWGGALIGFSAVVIGLGIASAVIADEMWRALVPSEAHANARPWLMIAENSAQAGMVMSW